ncbi:tol-pal system protein YbgF [Mangrovicella endophytica]|uniref:tol-pal system protein YbgF n=1 Tax=Mangrovicella endophytica TaxID=2066697 RepID=UPI0012FFED71|nr:tol-pal system protein YbgF [Mangrovicella endophytica]
MKNRSMALLVAAAALMAAPQSAGALNLGFGLGERHPAAQAERREAEPPVLLAQGADATVRISQLEEEIRRLTGKVEELSFQLLQMQEQIRKQQEDFEFRFQELEGSGSGGAGSGKRTDAGTPSAPATGGAASPAGGTSVASAQPPASATPPAAPGGAPAEDEIGAILGSGLDTSGLGNGNAPAAPPAAATPPAASGTVASITPEGQGGMYDLAYNYLLAGDYKLAEDAFRQYAQTYPDATDVPDAKYWLGESLFAQQKYTDAAEVFLNAQKQHPQSAKAPEMMLKLGMSLAKLDNRETACVTYAEVAKRYPKMSANVKKKLQQERTSANC